MNFEELATKPMTDNADMYVDIKFIKHTASVFYDFLTLTLKLKITPVDFYDLIVSANLHKTNTEAMQRLVKIQSFPGALAMRMYEIVVILNRYGFDLDVETGRLTNMRKLQNTKGGN